MKTKEDVKRKIEALKFLLEVERSKPEMERDYKLINNFKNGVKWLGYFQPIVGQDPKLIQGFEDSITWLEWIFQEADKE